jgi:hypothetical protein
MIITTAEIVSDDQTFGPKVQFTGQMAVDLATQLPIGISEDQFYTDLGKELVNQIKTKIGSQ